MNRFLKREYRYNRKFINSCILRIRYGKRDERTINGYKMYIFKAMKEIVNKNIQNYQNLLNGSPCRDIPDYNEIFSECYLIFDKCLKKFIVKRYANFYFYFNKALSRNFYRCYQRELNFAKVELSTEIIVTHPRLASSNLGVDTTELLLHNLRFTEIEKRICRSKLNGEKGTEFLRRNNDITQKQYNDAMKNIKDILVQLCKEENFERWLTILT